MQFEICIGCLKALKSKGYAYEVFQTFLQGYTEHQIPIVVSKELRPIFKYLENNKHVITYDHGDEVLAIPRMTKIDENKTRICRNYVTQKLI